MSSASTAVSPLGFTRSNSLKKYESERTGSEGRWETHSSMLYAAKGLINKVYKLCFQRRVTKQGLYQFNKHIQQIIF